MWGPLEFTAQNGFCNKWPSSSISQTSFRVEKFASIFCDLDKYNFKRPYWKICSIYIDDIIVWSQTFEEHLNHLSQIFDRFKKANLKLNPTNCHFAKPEVLYLGHIIYKDGIQVDPSKTDAVKVIWNEFLVK
jgi:hypothetical protein